ncbi:Cystathionine beta-lyase PatB [bioreactor metagenome]|uniref:cysteine-S-conjugate beta-lyase n=1 Tax=bioreactor metagenome TaxID=1076179 RepID=A0A645BIL3_9ZZZZ|nr:PatB family C-S lyase [Christensenella sp.]
MAFDFDEIVDRMNTDSIKFEAGLQINPYLPAEHIPLWVADMDFACAPAILAAMRERLDRRILGYTDLGVETKESVVQWMDRHFGWQPSIDEVVFSAGIVAALYAAVVRLTDPGDEVCFLTPAYGPFDKSVRMQGRVPLYSRMAEQNGYWTIDYNDLQKRLSRPSCKMFFHCNPQNPTGRVFTEEEQRKIGELCFANGVFIVSDEIHEDLTRAGIQHIPLAKLFPGERRIITCTSPSKTFNLAGNNHAHLFIPDPLLRRDWTKHYYNSHPSALSNSAVIAAYDESENWLEELRSYLDGSFKMMKSFLEERLTKAEFSIPEGTYLAWVNLAGYGLSEQELKQRISQAGVFVQFGEDFVDNGACHMRVNLASPRGIVREGLERIARAIEP